MEMIYFFTLYDLHLQERKIFSHNIFDNDHTHITVLAF